MDKGHANEKKEIIEQIKNRLSLENLLEIYNIRAGETKNTYHCPFHDDKNPSFSIKDKIWNCFAGCGSGDQISFIQKIDNLSFEDALIRASNLTNISIETKKNYKNFLDELEEKHINYLEKRGIRKETAKLFELKTKGDYILFPQKREGKTTGYKGINIKNKKMFFDGKDTQAKLFPDYECRGVKFLIFTAGEYDCLYLTQKLLESNLSEYKAITNSTGEGNFPKDLDRLLDLTNLEGFKIFYDHDESGKNGALKLAQELNSKVGKPVEIYFFSEEKKEKYDISDFFNEGNSLEDLFNLQKLDYKPKQEDKKYNYFLNSIDEFEFICPMQYQITEEGIAKIVVNIREERIDPVSSLPVIITEQAINTDDDIVNLKLFFKRNGEWKKTFVEREVISDKYPCKINFIKLPKNKYPIANYP